MTQHRLDCTFCDLIQGAAEVSICHEDADSIAFMDIQPVNNGHVLVVPREHYESLFDVPAELGHAPVQGHDALANAIRKVTGCEDMNIVVNSGEAAGQDEPHYHVHIIPRREGDGFDIPLPFDGSADARPHVLDAYAARIISALRDPMRSRRRARIRRASRTRTPKRTRVRSAVAACASRRDVGGSIGCLPTFDESELRADESPREETRDDQSVYLSMDEGAHGELRYEPAAELRDNA